MSDDDYMHAEECDLDDDCSCSSSCYACGEWYELAELEGGLCAECRALGDELEEVNP